MRRLTFLCDRYYRLCTVSHKDTASANIIHFEDFETQHIEFITFKVMENKIC